MIFRFLAEGIFQIQSGDRRYKGGWAGGPRGSLAQPAWWSGFGDFRVCGGDLAQRFVDMVGLDGERSAAGGGDPGGLGEEAEDAGIAFAGFGEHVEGGGIEDVALESGARQVPVEVSGDVFAREFRESRRGADAGEEGALDGEAQAAEKVVVAEEDHGHGASPSASGSQKQA